MCCLLGGQNGQQKQCIKLVYECMEYHKYHYKMLASSGGDFKPLAKIKVISQMSQMDILKQPSCEAYEITQTKGRL